MSGYVYVGGDGANNRTLRQLIILNGSIIIGERLGRGLIEPGESGRYLGFVAELAACFSDGKGSDEEEE